MGTIATTYTDKFIEGLFSAEHSIKAAGGHTLKLGLFKTLGNLAGNYGKDTEQYSDITGNSDENDGSGYTAEGETFPAADMTHDSNHKIFGQHSGTITYSSVSLSTDGCFLLNASHASKIVVATFAFSNTLSAINGDIILTLPAAAWNTALLRLGNAS